MEPRNEDQTTEPRKDARKPRFRIERLEERIAPTSTNKIGTWMGGGVSGGDCKWTGHYTKCH